MRRTFALIVAVAVGLMAAPAIGANPNAVQWDETDFMNAPTSTVTREAGDWIHERFSRAGTFTAKAGDFTYTGTVEWDAAGKIKLDKGRPVFGTFRGKGEYVFLDGDGPMVGTTCRSTFQSKLVEDFTLDPPFKFYGNQVAHCDDGSKIHGRIFGPAEYGEFDPEPPPGGFYQTVTGTLRN